VFERAFKFESATARIFQIFAEQPDCRVNRDLRASFVDFLVVHQNFPSENEGLSALSRGSQSTIHQEFVESELQGWLR
jgi:hypothetical protein